MPHRNKQCLTINTPTILEKRIALRRNLETSLIEKRIYKRIQMRLFLKNESIFL